MGRVKTYSSRHIVVTLGYHTAKAFADGGFLTIEAHGDGTSKTLGAGGDVVIGIDPDWTSTVTITFLQISPTANWCTNEYSKAQKTGIIDFFPILIEDPSSGLRFHAEKAWVSNHPTRDYNKGEASGNIEVIIETSDSTWEVGDSE